MMAKKWYNLFVILIRKKNKLIMIYRFISAPMITNEQKMYAVLYFSILCMIVEVQEVMSDII